LMTSEHVASEILPKLKERYQQLREEAINNGGVSVTQCDKKASYP
jgi:hypothetical protein